jgi:hypothetical protein
MTISTIKFSQFLNAGNITPNTTTVGLSAGQMRNLITHGFFLPPGTTAGQTPYYVVYLLFIAFKYRYW